MEEQATLIVDASTEYVGRWNLLVSTTNWEKGRIVHQWREALRQAGAEPACYTDDAWSRQVGGVSPQHVGRLRRTYERFGKVFAQYKGLYWSHFHAALDWPDAEMYLEGAVQNGWSVSQMRDQRWEATGGAADLKPLDSEIVASELDEDVLAADAAPPPTISETTGEVRGTEQFCDDDPAAYDAEDSSAPDSADAAADQPAVRPFESLPPLPSDLGEAFELMKLAVLNHKVSGWREISRDDLLAVLESLRQLALA